MSPQLSPSNRCGSPRILHDQQNNGHGAHPHSPLLGHTSLGHATGHGSHTGLPGHGGLPSHGPHELNKGTTPPGSPGTPYWRNRIHNTIKNSFLMGSPRYAVQTHTQYLIRLLLLMLCVNGNTKVIECS